MNPLISPNPFPSPSLNIRQPYDDFSYFSRQFTEGQLGDYESNMIGNEMMNEWENKEMMREVSTPRGGVENVNSPSGFAPMDHTRLSPSNFDPAKFTSAFVPPRFITGIGGVAGPALVEPSAAATGGMEKLNFSSSTVEDLIKQYSPPSSFRPNKFTPQAPHPEPTDSPVYDLYGSSVVSVNTTNEPFRSNPYPSPSIPGSAIIPPAPFNPAALGLPIPPDKSLGETNWKGLYSSSGFDLLGVLARVASRSNPVINIGPIDTGCSFLVCDATKYDQPIVYASATFEAMK